MSGKDNGMEHPETTRPRSRIGSTIGYGIVLAVALVALAGAFWNWREGRATRRESGRIKTAIGQLDGRLENLSRQMVPREEWLSLETQLARERARESGLEQRLGALEGRVASDREQVALQAASLLLNVGARLAPLERDARWSRGVLVTARDLLVPWPSARLMLLRRLLTADIRRLDALARKPGLRPGHVLTMLSLASPHWPLMMPRPLPSRIRKPGVVHGFWERLGGWLTRLWRSLVMIRSLPARVPPPPGPREAARIRLQLALDFSLARISWLSGRHEQYQADLMILRRFILRHFETRDAAVKKGLAGLASIRKPLRSFHWAPLLAALRAARMPVATPVRADP